MRTVKQSAEYPYDFADFNIVVEFNEGETVKEVSVDLLNDENVEGPEYLKVMLLNPSEGIIGNISEAIVHIRNDDSK